MERPPSSDQLADPVLPPRVLIVDGAVGDRASLRGLFAADPRVEVVATDGVRAALGLLAAGPFRLCLADLGTGGVDLVREVRRARRPVRMVVVAADPTIDAAVRAVRAGADDFLPKPLEPDRVRRIVDDVVRDAAVVGPERFYGVVSRNPRMHTIFALIRDVGPTTTTVLIQGETGTGKEQLARAIHAASVGRTGPFVVVNCAAVPATLLESELFGHEKGAFTGADRQRIGKFELAHGGTLFLDEVGDVPALMQVKLLRVLQERRFERVGGTDPIAVDVRVIAATNRPLRKLVRKGQFREDLYYRLNVVRIDLPPLRGRPDDVPALAAYFCHKYARPGNRPKQISPAALDRLGRYPWPGNIRELENAIERACVVNPADVIEPAHLPPELNRAIAGPVPAVVDLGRPLRDLLRDTAVRLEKRYIVKALRKTRGHVGRAATLCGYCRRSLTAKIAEYGIDRQSFVGKG
ncbi:MAG: DNA-binding response regulator [Gemmataceae bacterium]|nr:DNA-binding response regulator [Gemmataceae bacterium]